MKKLIAVLTLAAALAGCGSSSSKPSSQPPPHFASVVDNPWFPLKPGTTLVYRGVKDGKPSRDVVTVERGTKTIEGVRCTVVSDLLHLSGKLEERTTDWYAQDAIGNVWYYGERTAVLDPSGRVKSTSGSWQSGVNGARAGIYMPARPQVGQSGRQEYYKGQAEDHFRVKSLPVKVRTPGASSTQALLTEEWTPLEPGVLDHKYYVRGIGTVLEQTVKGGTERNTLVSVRRG
ncbi:MAG: hypothetical protein QOF65_1088 [Thermoleophilaceae bacterium]|jgi:hypothetical protein|nr:hypothetical protein [Thermoleophilaceae bacterium]